MRPVPRGAAARRPPAPPLLFLLLLALGPTATAARAVDIRFEAPPSQQNLPWGVTFTWSTPAQRAWPSTLAFTAAESGTSFFTVTALRTARVTAGSLVGALYITRGPGDDSGGSDRPLITYAPSVELWQANGGGSPPARAAAAACTFDGGGSSATLQTPGATARCAFAFAAPIAFDPEAPGELRISSVAFSGFPSATGFAPFPFDGFGATAAPSRCAVVSDTMGFLPVAGRPNPFDGRVSYRPIDNSPPRAPSAAAGGTEVCATTTWRYAALFPGAKCSATAWPVRSTGGGRGLGCGRTPPHILRLLLRPADLSGSSWE
jgi:hypothetical protein